MSGKKTQDNVILLKNVRLAFPELWTPKRFNDSEGKASFSAAFLLTPDHPDLQRLRSAIREVAVAKWKDKGDEVLKALIAGDKICLHNGDLKSNYDGFPGNWYVSARSTKRPLVIGQDKAVLSEEDGKPYSGCYVDAQIALWAMQNSYGKRINAQLRGVQFRRDGEAFGGGGVADPDDFDEIADNSADAPPPGDAGDPWGAGGEFDDLTGGA